MKVLIADKFEQVGLDGLTAIGCEVESQPDLSADGLPEQLKAIDPEVLIVRSTKVSDEAIGAAGRLKLILRAGAGFDTIQTATARQQGISVANCPGTNSSAVAELALGHMLSFDRRLPDQTADLRKGVWNKKGYAKQGRGLKGRTLGLVGVGQIGKLVARRAMAFEMRVLYNDIVACEELDDDNRANRVSFEDVLAGSDFVSLHVPSIESTQHLINEKTLAMMKPEALLINTTRGKVVDQVALVAALKKGTIAGAALDVYEGEPAAGDKEISNDLLNLPNFYGSHHVGASTEQAQTAVAEMAIEVVKTLKESGEVLNCVN